MALLITGLIATAGGTGAQFGFAAVVVGTVGMAHGASDLSLTRPVARLPFLVSYLLVVVLALAAWLSLPSFALLSFLLLSAAHFVLEDEADDRAICWCRGLLPIAAPAVFHRAELMTMFARLGAAPGIADLLWGGGLLAVGLLPLAVRGAARRKDLALFGLSAGAALLLPPLVGFAIAFTLLHAWPQLIERVGRTGSTGLANYLRRHCWILAGATVVVVVASTLFADRLTLLFAALAALATPHMLVTPRFTRD